MSGYFQAKREYTSQNFLEMLFKFNEVTDPHPKLYF